VQPVWDGEKALEIVCHRPRLCELCQ